MSNWLINEILKDRINNINVIEARPRQEQGIFLSNCDIGVVSLSKGMFGVGVPSKFYNLLAAEKPILYIGDNNTEIKLIIDQYKNGWYAKAGDVLNISEVIEQICQTEREKIVEMGKTSRILAEYVFSKSLILKKYESVFS
jgi:glycosyltransferase involved in cell wall biosynthesis